MNRLLRAVVAGGGLLAAAAQPTSPPAPAVKAAADQTPEELVADLGHPLFAVREKANRELWKRGAAARDAVAAGAKSSNPEVARRAQDLLDKIEWGLVPGAAPEVAKLVREFRSGDPPAQKAAVTGLLRLGRPGVAAARAALSKGAPSDVRAEMARPIHESPWRQLFEHVALEVRREVPRRLFDGRDDEADELVSLTALGPSPLAVADYAAYMVLRGKLDDAVARMEAARKDGGPAAEPARLALAHLYRAKRDWPKAREAAADFPRTAAGFDLVDMLLEEQGDWAELARRESVNAANLPDGLRMTFLRLAGRDKDAADLATEVLKTAADYTTRQDVRQAAQSLLLNHRAKEATDLLLDKRQNLGLLAELLIAQGRYKEALELVDGKRVKDGLEPQEKVEFDLRRGRLLFILGRRDDAVQVFGKVADAVRQNPEGGWDLDAARQAARSLLRAEVRLGLRDLAAEHAAQFLASDDPRVRDLLRRGETPFMILFDTDADAADSLFWTLRQKRVPGDEPGPTMRRVRELLAGTAAPAAVDEAVKLLRAEAPARRAGGGEFRSNRSLAVGRHLALAAVFRAAKRYDEAEQSYADAAKAASPQADPGNPDDDDTDRGNRSWVFGTSDDYRPWVEYGDFLTDRGRFADAAAKLEAGWKRFPDQPLLLYLSGRALVQAGDEKEGRRRVELAHWVTLGNEAARGQFLEELVRRGAAAAARRETDLLLRACWSRDGYFGNVMNQAGRASLLNKDYATAAACVQRSLLVLLKVPYVHFVEMSSYLTVPNNMESYRARALLAAGRVDDAMAKARECLRVVPASGDLAIGMVPELETRGRKAEADELFGAVWGAYRKTLADYPDSGSARNGAAWLAAGCRRELDTALEYAKQAVAIDPKSVGYRETLAEVHFRRGERDAAVALMEKLADEQPRSRHWKRQLARYRTGDTASPVANSEDE